MPQTGKAGRFSFKDVRALGSAQQGFTTYVSKHDVLKVWKMSIDFLHVTYFCVLVTRVLARSTENSTKFYILS